MVPQHQDPHSVTGAPRRARRPRSAGIAVAVVIAAAAASASSGCAGRADSESSDPSAPQVITLFDGETLDGWNVHGTESWYVEDGELVCESGPDAEYGYLATERSFTDFDLELEFLQEADGNSGVFFRSSLDGVIIEGWQAEVAPPGLYTGGIYESYGRGWLIQPEESTPDVQMGEWNELRVRVVGDTVTTWLNGVQKVSLVDEEIGKASGSIALQIHDGGGIKVRWRRLVLTELS